jgi:hypothetical protein
MDLTLSQSIRVKRSDVTGRSGFLQMKWVAVNALKKQPGPVDKGWFDILGSVLGPSVLHNKKLVQAIPKCHKRPQTWTRKGEWMYKAMHSRPGTSSGCGQLQAPATLPRGKNPRYPLDRHQNLLGRREEKTTPTGTQTPTLQPSDP